MEAYFEPTTAGHYFQILEHAKIMIIALNWRLQNTRPLSEDVERLRRENEESYEKALKLLEQTGDATSFTCNNFKVKNN